MAPGLFQSIIIQFYPNSSPRGPAVLDKPTKPNLPPLRTQNLDRRARRDFEAPLSNNSRSSSRSSDDAIPTHPRKHSSESTDYSPYRIRYLFQHLFLLTFSAAMLVVLYLFLKAYENGEMPAYNDTKKVTLNAAVAWLGMLAKIGIVVTLAETVGQVKWAYFEKARRKFSDIELMDAAGRNPLSAFAWILRFRSGILVHLGAAFMILSLGFDPSLQHLLHYDLVSLPDASQPATLAQNTAYAPVRGFNKGLVLAAPKSLLLGAYASVLGDPLLPSVSCPSGNCTFPSTSSVGVCSVCTEVTTSLTRTCKDLSTKSKFCVGSTCFTSGQLCTYSHNNVTVGGGDLFLNIAADQTTTESGLTGGKSFIPRERVNLTALYIQPDPEHDYPAGIDMSSLDTTLPIAPGFVNGSNHNARAFTCALSYCEQQHSSSVTLGNFTESTKEAPDQVDGFELDTPDITEITDNLLNQKVSLTDGEDSTQLTLAALYAFSEGFGLALTGNASVIEDGAPAPGQISELHRALYENLETSDFSTQMDAMTSSISSAIRNSGSTTAQGTTFVHRILVRVSWYWFTWAIALWGFVAALFLGVNLWTRKRRAAWLGGSLLAVAFVGLEEEVRRDVDAMSASWGDKGGMREVGEKVRLRVAPGHGLADRVARVMFSRSGGRGEV